jgi:hypothetical protein
VDWATDCGKKADRGYFRVQPSEKKVLKEVFVSYWVALLQRKCPKEVCVYFSCRAA